ncbi:MAG TPA: bifunctional serine/threonine-protein kinase/formylglycine-generating enzyme family protein [Polyangiaceae bacterium]|jgi:formylglycine-generating enzyme required for sulfatase activity/predicted Ser/Thr protein kinase
MDTPDLDEQLSSSGADFDDFLRRVANAPPRMPPTLPVSGERWGRSRRYRIENCLGKGGMGAVYLAYDLLLDRFVALKVLHLRSEIETPDDRGRLLREARAAACVDHDRIARVYDVGEHDGVPFVAMEYVRGMTLRRWMAGRVVEPSDVIALGVQIAEGLDALHRVGIVHRDLKPENVMLPEAGGLKILDLGLAKRSVASEGEIGEHHFGLRLGTPGYMAPEQYDGAQVDARADVFALGVMLYELATRKRPWEYTSVADVARATLTEPASFSSERWRLVSPALKGIVEATLAKEPAQRIPDARTLLERLVPLLPPGGTRLSSNPLSATIDLEHAPTLAVASGQSLMQLASRSRKHPVRLLGGVALVALIAAFVMTGKPSPAEDMNWVPRGMTGFRGGKFTMGRTGAELDAECARMGKACEMPLLGPETPAAEGRMHPFAIDNDEVVVSDFAELLEALKSQTQVDPDDDGSGAPRFVRFSSGLHKGELVADIWHGLAGITYDGRYHVVPGAERRPMRLVSWLGANVYCRYRGARLPTEAEWEYAARGATKRRFPWGDAAPRCSGVAIERQGPIAVDTAGGCPAPLEGPLPIGSSVQDVTPEGVRDLGGNVSEWTDTKLRLLAGAITAAPSTSEGAPGDVDDPMALRGGSYNDSFLTRTTARTRMQRGAVAKDAGFRCASTPPY